MIVVLRTLDDASHDLFKNIVSGISFNVTSYQLFPYKVIQTTRNVEYSTTMDGICALDMTTVYKDITQKPALSQLILSDLVGSSLKLERYINIDPQLGSTKCDPKEVY